MTPVCFEVALRQMSQPHPIRPHGVPNDWGRAPAVYMGCRPYADAVPRNWPGPMVEEWRGICAWWVAYEAETGNPAPDADVVIGEVSLAARLRSGEWRSLYLAPSQWAAAFREPSVTQDASIKLEHWRDCVIARPGRGMHAHGGMWQVETPWGLGGADLTALYAHVSHKSIGPNADQSRIVVQCGIDYWPSMHTRSADLAPATYIPGAALGRFELARPTWSHSHVAVTA